MSNFIGSSAYNALLLGMAVAIVAYIVYRNVRSDGWLRTGMHAISSIVMACVSVLIIMVLGYAIFGPYGQPTQGAWGVVFNIAVLTIVLRYAGPYSALWCAELTDRLEARAAAHWQRRHERQLHARWARQIADKASAERLDGAQPKALQEPQRRA